MVVVPAGDIGHLCEEAILIGLVSQSDGVYDIFFCCCIFCQRQWITVALFPVVVVTIGKKDYVVCAFRHLAIIEKLDGCIQTGL